MKLRGISINLTSQHTLLNLPEYPIPSSFSPVLQPAQSAPSSSSSSHPHPDLSPSHACDASPPAPLPPPSPSPPPDANLKPPSPPIEVSSTLIPLLPNTPLSLTYQISPPHPPSAKYLLKLLLNSVELVSWDVTSRRGYSGRMCYSLVCDDDPQHTSISGDERGGGGEAAARFLESQGFLNQGSLRREGLKFAGLPGESEEEGGGGMIEVRVLRIEKRVRIRAPLLEEEGQAPRARTMNMPEVGIGDGLCVTNAGFLEQSYPARRYKYQLLDPKDEPYATFRWYYRSSEWLAKHGIEGSDWQAQVRGEEGKDIEDRESEDGSGNWYEASEMPGAWRV